MPTSPTWKTPHCPDIYATRHASWLTRPWRHLWARGWVGIATCRTINGDWLKPSPGRRNTLRERIPGVFARPRLRRWATDSRYQSPGELPLLFGKPRAPLSAGLLSFLPCGCRRVEPTDPITNRSRLGERAARQKNVGVIASRRGQILAQTAAVSRSFPLRPHSPARPDGHVGYVAVYRPLWGYELGGHRQLRQGQTPQGIRRFWGAQLHPVT